MHASGSLEGLRVSTIFQPEREGPVSVHKEINCSPPTHLGVGWYQTFTPNLGEGRSIIERASDKGGNPYVVSAVITREPSGPGATIDIHVWSVAGALSAPSDAAEIVEVTIEATPIA